MTERLLIVLVVVAVVVALTALLRRRPRVRRYDVADTGLPAGVYLLTSDGCDTCERARVTLVRRGTPHTELSWQKNPDVFERLGIDAVPSVLTVDESGAGAWFRGGVPSARLGGSRAPEGLPGVEGEGG